MNYFAEKEKGKGLKKNKAAAPFECSLTTNVSKNEREEITYLAAN